MKINILLAAMGAVLGAGTARAQTALLPDTLEYARAKAYGKDFGEADRILTLYNARTSRLDGLRLQAQVLYWAQDFKRAAAVHEQALAAFPSVPALRLDYARLLVEQNQLDRAKDQLAVYETQDSARAESGLLLALISYKQLRLDAARKSLAAVLRRYPGNAAATALLQDIGNTTLPYFRVGSRYLHDDQPLRALTYEAEATLFRSWLVAPTVQLQANSFSLPDDRSASYWLQVGNKFTFLPLGLTVSTTGGLFQYSQNSGGSLATGNLLLTKTLGSTLALDVQAARQPYQAVLASARQPVMERLQALAVRYTKGDKWLGKAGVEQRSYGDDNPAYSTYAWLLAPVLTRPTVVLKAGYAFSYASAERSTYTPTRSLSDVVLNGGPVPGAYVPYFTPRHQLVNAMLLSLKLWPQKKVSVAARGSYGVQGRADAPYLYLDKALNNELYLATGFARQDYHPVEVQGEVALKASPSLTVAATYGYSSLIFYNRHAFDLQFRYHLNREKNR
ncbi:tetratricopeptide repeat protein [Hymenobacter armeniacus]|uniref:Tetratricopeptide repeat protein n=1 Tax=Hymenobacter armeniacus TaxID=2771358 RepID=A0ABR8JRT3_9BACT|nr:tetratricopeptide repeat protein [Hymenobacter armeniacus]MBD2722689.1 tetratricopeptide repeat protein [Hymenobacter armeniacus]